MYTNTRACARTHARAHAHTHTHTLWTEFYIGVYCEFQGYMSKRTCNHQARSLKQYNYAWLKNWYRYFKRQSVRESKEWSSTKFSHPNVHTLYNSTCIIGVPTNQNVTRRKNHKKAKEKIPGRRCDVMMLWKSKSKVSSHKQHNPLNADVFIGIILIAAQSNFDGVRRRCSQRLGKVGWVFAKAALVTACGTPSVPQSFVGQPSNVACPLSQTTRLAVIVTTHKRRRLPARISGTRAVLVFVIDWNSNSICPDVSPSSCGGDWYSVDIMSVNGMRG